jgi:hypothetical protein
MLQVPVDILNPLGTTGATRITLDRTTHASDGRLPFYRGELFLSDSEVQQLNESGLTMNCPYGKPQFVEVTTPPLVQNYFTPVATAVTFSPLPPRSTRASFPSQPAPRPSSSGGKSSGGKSNRASALEVKPESSVPSKAPSSAHLAPPAAETPRVQMKVEEPPIIPANREKIQQFISERFSELAADQDYMCLYEEYFPQDVEAPISLSSVKQRVERESYLDHFQMQDDLLSLCAFWLHGPPMPNPMLPQYMAALKLIRKSTELMISRSTGIENKDYYSGPDVEAAIRAETKREQAMAKSTSSPSFARKVRKTQSTAGQSGSELKDIETQVAMLTQQVMGMQKSKPAGASAAASSAPRQEAMSVEEIRRLEADLIRLSPEDIDFVINSLLKGEPSVKVDDESYELDVGALPAAKQRALRRFVSRRLNIVDPTHEVQKLKQMLRQDELARASEEMAERLLAASAVVAPVAPIAPLQSIISPEEELRQRQREEEAKRLWQLAHGGDDDQDSMDVD